GDARRWSVLAAGEAPRVHGQETRGLRPVRLGDVKRCEPYPAPKGASTTGCSRSGGPMFPWILSAVLAMAFAPPAGRVPRGDWGGDHVHLVVTAKAATVEFDCGHGTLDAAFRVDASGRFDVKGQYVPEHAGPIGRDEAATPANARYSGSLKDGVLTM